MRKIIFCSLALLINSLCLLRAQPLKISVQKGQKYKAESSMKMVTVMKMGVDSFESFMETSSTIIYKVLNSSSGETELESTLTHITSRFNLMGEDSIYDKDKKEDNDTTTKKSKKIIVDHNGKIIKAEKPEKKEGFASENGWMFSGRDESTDLFMPEFIGKEFKEGYSFPVATGYRKEKASTSFSLDKETISVADTGTYTIDSIRNGIASITFTSIQIMTMRMKIMEKFVTSVSKSIKRSDLRVDMNTGIVLSKIITEESVPNFTSNNPADKGTYKAVSTITINLLE